MVYPNDVGFLNKPVSVADAGVGTPDTFEQGDKKIDALFDSYNILQAHYYDFPALSIYPSTQQSVPNATYDLLQFNTKEWDYGNWYNTSTDRYTPGSAGLYHFDVAVYISSSVANRYLKCVLYKNGSSFRDIFVYHTDSTYGFVYPGSITVEANGSTDYFSIYLYHNFGAAVNVIGWDVTQATRLQIDYLGKKP